MQGLDEGDILDPAFQMHLENARALLRQEIQRELKIKEAAERMRRAVTNRKSAADVDDQLKASSRKLDKLHWELQELNARSMTTEKDANHTKHAGEHIVLICNQLSLSSWQRWIWCLCLVRVQRSAAVLCTEGWNWKINTRF